MSNLPPGVTAHDLPGFDDPEMDNEIEDFLESKQSTFNSQMDTICANLAKRGIKVVDKRNSDVHPIFRDFLNAI